MKRETGVADRPARAALSAPRVIGADFRRYESYDVDLVDLAGGQSRYQREVVRTGPVVGVLAVDLVRDCVVLIRQFRLGAHLGTGLGESIELVAGRCDGESPLRAAVRECSEEIGCEARRIVQIMRLLPAPSIADECMTLFVAEVDSRAVPATTGLAHEQEHLQTLVLPMDVALTIPLGEAVHNSALIIALQWLALNRHRLGDILGA